jgi:transcriptional regulator of nitric oxide reductase
VFDKGEKCHKKRQKVSAEGVAMKGERSLQDMYCDLYIGEMNQADIGVSLKDDGACDVQ